MNDVDEDIKQPDIRSEAVINNVKAVSGQHNQTDTLKG